MNLRVEPHTLERARERGATEAEIEDVFRTGREVPAKHGRLAREKVYPFGRERLGRAYEEKKVVLVYTVEEGVAVSVTVKVYYGRWED